MSYLVKFYDNHTIIVSDQEGEKLKEARFPKFPTLNNIKTFSIRDNNYSVSTIDRIERIQTEKKFNSALSAPPVSKEVLDRVSKELKNRFNWE